MSKSMHYSEYVKYKKRVDEYEKNGEGESKTCAKARSIAISYWNALTPTQQKEIAEKYIPPTLPD